MNNVVTRSADVAIGRVERPPRKLGHVVELDGLRAIAIGLVLFGHFLFLPPTTEAGRAFLPRPLAVVIAHGWLGVDLFFVLSGFLITGILLRSKQRGRGAFFRHFYERRVLRIAPLYAVVLAVLAIVDGGRHLPYFALCAAMAANLASAFHVSIPDAAGPFWSLAVEEQFYLVWPWLVLWLDERRLAAVALGIMVIEPLLRGFLPGVDNQQTWFRADGLAMGALVAVWYAGWNGQARGARTFALTLLGVFGVSIVTSVPFGGLHDGTLSDAIRISQGVLVFGAGLVVCVAFAGSAALRPLRATPLVFVALVSYCVYLVHRPLLLETESVLTTLSWYHGLPPVESTTIRSAVALVATLLVASASRRWLELPFLRLGRDRNRTKSPAVQAEAHTPTAAGGI